MRAGAIGPICDIISKRGAGGPTQHNTTEYTSINRSQYQFISRYEDINTV
jgi:hypothetical protein